MATQHKELGAAKDLRFGSRSRIALDVLVRCGEDYACRGTTRDLGMGGAFVELPDGGPPLAMAVELAFTSRGAAQPDSHRVLADVVRSSATGIGLRFRDYDNETYTALMALLYPV